MATLLFILNGPPYGNEHSFNGLRLADNLVRHEGIDVKVFLIGDAAACAKRGQKVPHGFYNIELMLHPILRHGGQIGGALVQEDFLARLERNGLSHPQIQWIGRNARTGHELSLSAVIRAEKSQ